MASDWFIHFFRVGRLGSMLLLERLSKQHSNILRTLLHFVYHNAWLASLPLRDTNPFIYTMAPVRIRHPGGIATIQVPFDDDSFTVQGLQQAIHTVSGIWPSQQDLKTGYPPRSLAIIPELPLASLGLKQGDQLIVNQKSGQTGVSATPNVKSAVNKNSASATSDSPKAAIAPARTPIEPDYVEVDGSFLMHRIVPDDNSCLFSSIALIFRQDISKAPDMRKIAAEGIKNNPDTYTEAILGLPPAQYIAKILSPQTWGGAIELGVFANYFHTEIASIDVETGRIDQFEPAADGTLSNRCVLIYSGIHYDATALTPMKEAPAEWHQTVFPISSSEPSTDPILAAAKALATKLREKKAFTNTATFDLKCEECGRGLKGEKEARKHAEATGHVRFGEY